MCRYVPTNNIGITPDTGTVWYRIDTGTLVQRSYSRAKRLHYTGNRHYFAGAVGRPPLQWSATYWSAI